MILDLFDPFNSCISKDNGELIKEIIEEENFTTLGQMDSMLAFRKYTGK